MKTKKKPTPAQKSATRRAQETPAQREARLAADRKRQQERRDALKEGTQRQPNKRGPKPIREGDPTRARSITLPESYWPFVEEIGDGEASAGVRSLVEKEQKSAARRRKNT